MTGRISGVVTWFQNVVNTDFIRIWCGAHQLEIVIQSVYSKLNNEAFYTQLKALISYIWRQQNFDSVIQLKAPKVVDTRWESMFNVSDWFKKHKI